MLAICRQRHTGSCAGAGIEGIERRGCRTKRLQVAEVVGAQEMQKASWARRRCRKHGITSSIALGARNAYTTKQTTCPAYSLIAYYK